MFEYVLQAEATLRQLNHRAQTTVETTVATREECCLGIVHILSTLVIAHYSCCVFELNRSSELVVPGDVHLTGYHGYHHDRFIIILPRKDDYRAVLLPLNVSGVQRKHLQQARGGKIDEREAVTIFLNVLPSGYFQHAGYTVDRGHLPPTYPRTSLTPLPRALGLALPFLLDFQYTQSALHDEGTVNSSIISHEKPALERHSNMGPFT